MGTLLQVVKLSLVIKIEDFTFPLGKANQQTEAYDWPEVNYDSITTSTSASKKPSSPLIQGVHFLLFPLLQ